MKIKLINSTFGDYEELQGLEISVETETSLTELKFSDGEPEDANLCRDFADVFSIKDALVAAYEAGKRGEAIEIEEIDVVGDEDDE